MSIMWANIGESSPPTIVHPKLGLVATKLLCILSASDALKGPIIDAAGITVALSMYKAGPHRPNAASFTHTAMVALRNLSDRQVTTEVVIIALDLLMMHSSSDDAYLTCAGGILCNGTSNNSEIKTYLIQNSDIIEVIFTIVST